ncbi:hypothetical protein FAGAP_3238 [Fusarium agapanthi]|uniref:DUF7600 domain-containing protein n=1 Tax=Fusarium agapanthi TaxID=1803897 RepID=A0A9P5BEH6_9HYPO|nr:hypothetical protein FAGAP_3238 [Fusarium agapanthi]
MAALLCLRGQANGGALWSQHQSLTSFHLHTTHKITGQPGETWLDEFRAIWVESNLLNNVAVSGVGRWSNSDDELFGTAPVDPKKYYNDDAGPGTTIDNDVFLSRINFNAEALTTDPFFRLFPDILQSITVLLSTSEIHAVRLASPVFASLKLSERFWASRFQPGHEFEHIPEIIDYPPESWRAFYLSLQIWALDNPSMANRKRIWGLAKTLHGLLSQMEDAPCQGRPLQTWFETSADPDDTSACWHTAACASAQPNGSFVNGNRGLRARTLRFSQTLKVQQMSVSFVKLPEGVFDSGLVLIDHNHERHAIGYIHESNMVGIHLPIAQYIQGWELALHTSGVKAMALIYEDGLDPPSFSAIKAEFDAIKLVKLSREGSPDELSWLNNCLWYPQVPPMGLVYDWNKGDKPPSKFKLPITSVFFGEADDMNSSILTEIVIWIFDICYIAGIEFRFTDASYNRDLGNIGPFDQEFSGRRNFSDSNDSSVSLIIDGVAGERLKSFEVQERGASLVGMKMNTTFNRHVQTPGYPYGMQKGWVTIQPKGSKIVGMFATCHLALSILSMTPIKTPKRVRFRDQYERPNNKASLTQTRKLDGITILKKKDEVYRIITSALSRFLKPLEIPPKTLIEHCLWSAGGIYTIRSVEPILPNTRYDIAVRVIKHLGWVEVFFSMAGGLFDRVSLPPVQWIEVPNKEVVLNNGMRVCAQIEDSIHGQLLASYLKKMGLFELQGNGTTDLEMESPQLCPREDHGGRFGNGIDID